MEPLYILFVSAGGVFLVLLFAYFLVGIDSWRHKVKTKKNIHKAYNDKNLAKIEYDCAFYDGDLYSRDNSNEHAKQVTIDELLSGEAESDDEGDELTRFYPIEEIHENVVVGHFDPESVSDYKN